MASAPDVYRPQLGPAQSVPMPMEDPRDNPLVAIGEGMQRLGGTAHQANVQAYKVERQLEADREASDFAARFAEARAKFDAFSIERRNAAPADAAGHTEAMRVAWDAEQQVLLQGLTEESIANNARAQLASFGERLVSSEMQWAEGQRVAKTVTDQQRMSDIGANRARQLHDPQAYAEEIQAGRETIARLNVPEAIREKLALEHDQVITVGYLNGLTDREPQVALALLDAGTFNEVLDPRQLEQVRNGAMVEVRRAEAAAAHEANLRKQALREEVESAKSLIGAGVDVPDAELQRLQQSLTEIGDTGGATSLGVLRVQNGIRRETEPWTPAQFDAEINRLTGKANRSAEEDIRLDALRQQRPNAVATYNNNPGEWASRNGLPPPEMNIADPASVSARLRWARTVEAQTGRPVAPLLPAEASALREQAEASPLGRVAVADQIAQLGGFATLQAARQIAPNDPMLGRLAQLGSPWLRREAAKGAEVRATRKDVIDGVNGNDARAEFDAGIGQAAGLMAPEDLGAAYEVARNIYAARVQGDRFDKDAFDQAMHEALGGTIGQRGERLGGIGSHGRNAVLLPSGMSDATFDRAMARLAARAPQGEFAPVWADGTPMTGAELSRYIPVQRPDGRYEFRDADGARVTVKDGRAFIFDVAQFVRRAGL